MASLVFLLVGRIVIHRLGGFVLLIGGRLGKVFLLWKGRGGNFLCSTWTSRRTGKALALFLCWHPGSLVSSWPSAFMELAHSVAERSRLFFSPSFAAISLAVAARRRLVEAICVRAFILSVSFYVNVVSNVYLLELSPASVLFSVLVGSARFFGNANAAT